MGRPILLHAHPGHELRLFHWMESRRPVVFLLTDGSGGGLPPRTDHSRRCIAQAGALQRPLPGPCRDAEWYRAILRGDIAPFQAVVAAVTAAATEEGSTLIASDAVDGYNPMHDLCEAIATAVTKRLAGARHLVSRAVAGDVGTIACEHVLDAAAIGRKRDAVAAYMPLAEEARRLLDVEETALRVERLRHPHFTWPEQYTPEWEETGRARVASQRYGEAIEYARHVRPIARALLTGGGA